MKLSIDKRDIISILLGFLFIIYFSLNLSSVFRVSQNTQFIISYIYLAYFVFAVLRTQRIRYVSAGMMVIYYTLLEGIGIPIARVLAPRFTQEQLARSVFFYGQYVDRYISLCLLSTTIMLVVLLLKGKKNNVEEREISIKPEDEIRAKAHFAIGLIALCFFAGYMLYNLVTGSFTIGDYGLYKQWSGTAIRNYSQIAYWISPVFICSCGSKKQIGLSFIIFLIPSAILFVLGNRNDVLFPLLIGLGIYYLRFKKLPKGLLIGTLITIFIFGPIVVQIRNGGQFLISNSFNGILESIGQSFFELGAELHAVSNTFQWMENGEPLAFGATIILGVLSSLLRRFIPSVTDFFESSRYYIAGRLPSLGYTMSAEVYFNFSIIGVFVIYGLIGSFIAVYESKVNSLKKLEWYGFCTLWLLILVRNSFGHSFVYAKVYFIMMIISYIIIFLQRKKNGAWNY